MWQYNLNKKVTCVYLFWFSAFPALSYLTLVLSTILIQSATWIWWRLGILGSQTCVGICKHTKSWVGPWNEAILKFLNHTTHLLNEHWLMDGSKFSLQHSAQSLICTETKVITEIVCKYNDIEFPMRSTYFPFPCSLVLHLDNMKIKTLI